MKIYLAGPMTGIPHFNFPAFEATAAMLRSQGHEVFSPAEHDIQTNGEDFHVSNPEGDTKNAESNGFSLRGALKADLDWICDHAEGIYLMPGWENSRGARTEHALAVTLGLRIIYA
jgi:hypothetical protein